VIDTANLTRILVRSITLLLLAASFAWAQAVSTAQIKGMITFAADPRIVQLALKYVF
jgi:hypothetical protein